LNPFAHNGGTNGTFDALLKILVKVAIRKIFLIGSTLFLCTCGGSRPQNIPQSAGSTSFSDTGAKTADQNGLVFQNFYPVINSTTAPNTEVPTVIPHTLNFDPSSGQIVLSTDVDQQKGIKLKGKIDSTDGTWLQSDDQNTQAFAVCLEDNLCDNMVVTVYQKGKKGHTQFETHLQTPPAQVTEEQVATGPQAPSSDDDEPSDEGKGTEEYETPPSPFESVQTQPDTLQPPKKAPGTVSQAIGPHHCVAEKDAKENKTGKVKCGHLSNGVLFPSEGIGFQFSSEEKKFLWATQDLVDTVSYVLKDTALQFPDRPLIQVGAVSLKNGGRNTHQSHQNGLDIDIAYPVKDDKLTAPWSDMTSGSTVNPNFDFERFWHFCKSAASTGRVIFLFVDPPIKKSMCTYVKSINEFSENPDDIAFKALMTLWPSAAARGETGHKNHVHLREQCPPGRNKCLRDQPPSPEADGTGC
jgi:murein endopeptidase